MTVTETSADPMANSPRTPLRISALHKSYGDNPALAGVDLDVAPGEFVALLGANGSGKSTLLRCVAGLETSDAGSITLAGTEICGLRGRELAHARRGAAMVFQRIHLVRRRSALDNVCAGALGRLSVARSLTPLTFPRAVRNEAMECLHRVGLAEHAGEAAGRLSGGQQQRVAIARALCQRAGIMLADEPVSALDPKAAAQVLALLRELAREGHAVAAVLHQPDMAREYSDRIVGLLNGRIRVDAGTENVSESDTEAIYEPERCP